MASLSTRPLKAAKLEAERNSSKTRRECPTDYADASSTTCYWRVNPEESYSDWTIEVEHEEGEFVDIYHVHKAVLSLGKRRSEYFAKMFQGQYYQEQASQTSTLKLSTIEETKLFPLLLDFIYGDGSLEICNIKDEQELVALFSFEDYFIIPELGKTIGKKIEQNGPYLGSIARKVLEESADWSADPLVWKLLQAVDFYVPRFFSNFTTTATLNVVLKSAHLMVDHNEVWEKLPHYEKECWLGWAAEVVVKSLNHLQEEEGAFLLETIRELCPWPYSSCEISAKLLLIYLVHAFGNLNEHESKSKGWLESILSEDRSNFYSYFGGKENANKFLEALPKELLISLVMVEDKHFSSDEHDSSDDESGDY